MEWSRFLEHEVNEFHREDYYLAQIAREIRRTVVKNPSAVKVEDFILKYQLPGGKAGTPSPAADSKAFWLGALGVKKETA